MDELTKGDLVQAKATGRKYRVAFVYQPAFYDPDGPEGRLATDPVKYQCEPVHTIGRENPLARIFEAVELERIPMEVS